MRRGGRGSAASDLRAGHGSQRQAGVGGRKIEITIEELVLEGFNLSDRYTIGDTLSRELELLLAEGAPLLGLAGGDRERGPLDLGHLRAGSITLKPGTPAAEVGTQVARAVHGALQTVGSHGNGKNGPGLSSPGKSD